jgi:hypothetical protein
MLEVYGSPCRARAAAPTVTRLLKPATTTNLLGPHAVSGTISANEVITHLLYSAPPILTRSKSNPPPKNSPRHATWIESPSNSPLPSARFEAAESVLLDHVAGVNWPRDLGPRFQGIEASISSSHERGVRGIRAAVLRGLRLSLPQVHCRLRPQWR